MLPTRPRRRRPRPCRTGDAVGVRVPTGEDRCERHARPDPTTTTTGWRGATAAGVPVASPAEVATFTALAAQLPESLGELLAWRVRQSPEREAFRFQEGDGDWQARDLARDRRGGRRGGGGPALARAAARAAGGHRVGHALGVGARRPGRDARGRCDDDGLPVHPAGGRRLHPRRLRLGGRHRRGRRAAGEGARPLGATAAPDRGGGDRRLGGGSGLRARRRPAGDEPRRRCASGGVGCSSTSPGWSTAPRPLSRPRSSPR